MTGPQRPRPTPSTILRHPQPLFEVAGRLPVPENKANGIDAGRLVATARRFATSEAKRDALDSDVRNLALRSVEQSNARQEHPNADRDAPRCSSDRVIRVETNVEGGQGDRGYGLIHADDGSVCECPALDGADA